MFHDLEFPRLLVSRCLLGEACRYDGQAMEFPGVLALLERCQPHSICPEVEAGFGTPRPPMRLIRTERGLSLFRERESRDFAPPLLSFSRERISELPPVHGAILKARSPSCGVGSCKLYEGSFQGERIGHASGLFAQTLAEERPALPLIDEEGLLDPKRRWLFLFQVSFLAKLGLGGVSLTTDEVLTRLTSLVRQGERGALCEYFLETFRSEYRHEFWQVRPFHE